jgi:hypothetical protein
MSDATTSVPACASATTNEVKPPVLTLSFVILNDLRHMFEPVVQETNGTLEEAVAFLQRAPDLVASHLGYTINDHVCGWQSAQQVETNAQSLLEDKYLVYNRVSKYYVLAFAVNWARFDVYSKDCDKKLMTWRDNDENDPIVDRIVGEDYRENPVVTLLKNLHA